MAMGRADAPTCGGCAICDPTTEALPFQHMNTFQPPGHSPPATAATTAHRQRCGLGCGLVNLVEECLHLHGAQAFPREGDFEVGTWGNILVMEKELVLSGAGAAVDADGGGDTGVANWIPIRLEEVRVGLSSEARLIAVRIRRGEVIGRIRREQEGIEEAELATDGVEGAGIDGAEEFGPNVAVARIKRTAEDALDRRTGNEGPSRRINADGLRGDLILLRRAVAIIETATSAVSDVEFA